MLATGACTLPADQRAAALEKEVAALRTEVERQKDIEAVRTVAFSYAYYMDYALYSQVQAMFSPKIVSCEVAGYGVFKGQAGCARSGRSCSALTTAGHPTRSPSAGW